MKRFHIHIAVNELSESINFYSTIFDTPPSVTREDYAKWDLTEPAINFAISQRGSSNGINHLGIQVDSDTELKALAERLDKAEITLSEQKGISCCYSRSNKHWALDPEGIAWETFHTLESIPTFTKKTEANAGADTKDKSPSCCIPEDVNHASNNSPNNHSECCVSKA